MNSTTRELFRDFANVATGKVVQETESVSYTHGLSVDWRPATKHNSNTGETTEIPQGSLHTENYAKPDYYRLVHDCRETVTQLCQFKRLREHLYSEYECIVEYHSPNRELNKILLGFLVDLFEKSCTNTLVSFLDEDFDRQFKDYISSLDCDSISVSAIVPLAGLVFDGDSIKLDKNTCIRRTTTEDLEFFLGTSDQEEHMHWTNSQSLIEYRFAKQKSAEQGRDTDISQSKRRETKQRIENILTSMRISHSGNAVYFAHYERSKAPWLRGIRSTIEKNRVRPRLWGDLTIDQEEKLLNMYGILESKDFSSMESNLRMAIEKFNSSYVRRNDRVAFSDLIIILEALYSANSGQEGLHRSDLAQRVAILLGTDPESKERIRDDIAELYDERSGVWGVAHGGGRRELKEDSLEKSRGYVRKSLEQILSHEMDFGGRNNLIKEMRDEIRRSSLGITFP
ncbi:MULTISPECIES: HEPN domain-containing protein [Halococcus]|uniref:HEPN domain-containing protein n=1 Tax=Halococcus TaxID=2249 RepID=UPI000AAD1DC7|nr:MULTISPECIES: HEPN domain-containing protein [Halococcus]